jgi:hypothetical protein
LAFSIIQNYYTKSNNFQKKDANQNFFICQTAVKQIPRLSATPFIKGEFSTFMSPPLDKEGVGGDLSTTKFSKLIE